MATKRDYYDILGVSRSASPEEIKRAYRQHALEHHPDRGGDAEKFKEFNEAYAVLKDPKKRAAYDQFGHDGPGFEGFRTAGGFGGFDFEDIARGFDFDMDLDLGDIFSNFFGGGSRTAQSTRQVSQGKDVQVEVAIDFKEAVFGTTETLNLELEDVCERCSGRGAEPDAKLEVCKTCNGSGRVVRTQRTILGTIQQTTTCPRCEGRGEVPEKLCKQCRGVGTLLGRRTVTVRIPEGISDGSTVRIAGAGGAVPNGKRGDLYLLVNVRAHPPLERRGLDIVSEQSVDMVTAVVGGEVVVETIDGEVRLKIPAGTQPGTIFKINGHGVPYRGGGKRGNHLVKVDVEIPKHLTLKQKRLLKEFFDETSVR